MKNALKLVWNAIFKDGSELFQFKDIVGQEDETPFKQVLDKQDSLSNFCLYNTGTRIFYVVDLELGIIRIVKDGGTVPVPEEDTLRNRDYKYRLIYFRRVRRNFGADLKELGDADITYFLGYQFTDEFGRNHKRLMQIYGDDRVMIY